MVGATLALLVTAMVARAPAAAAAGTSGAACAAATSGAHVHYVTGFVAGAADGPAIAGLTIDGFDAAACDGLPVQVVISGNAAGSDVDPADELLSTLDSTLDPCTGAKLGTSVTISAGSITLNGCASVHDPNGAAYASIHDATQLVVKVADALIPAVISGVTPTTPTATSTSPTSPRSSISNAGSGASSSHGVGGVSASRSGGSSGAGGQASGHHNLASTGVDIALLAVAGLILILCGWLLLRRRSTEHGH
jgi:hypothetical protein